MANDDRAQRPMTLLPYAHLAGQHIVTVIIIMIIR